MKKSVFTFCLIALFSTSVVAQTASSQATSEIRNLVNNAKVKEAFQYIESIEDQTIKDLIMLTEIPAPPFKEEVRAKKYMEMLKDAGADEVWMDEVGNVLARRKGKTGGKVVALDAHLDTVFPEGTDVTVKMRGDTLFAPGIGDDTAGLRVVLTVLRALEKANIETDADVLFIGTVGEEGLGDLRGVKHLFRDGGPKIDSWIAVDGGGIDRIVHRGLGSHRYKVTFKGPGGHSWGAFGLSNPHHALGLAISYFVEGANRFTATGDKTSYNVGRIGGGTSINSIPFESWMEIDMRSVNPERLNSIDDILQAAVQRALKDHNAIKRDGPDLTVDVEMVGNRPSGSIDANAPLVQRAVASAEYFGVEPRLAVSSTDSNIPISKGIPSITIGRGGIGSKAHSLDEWWVNKRGYAAIQNALLILLAEAGSEVGRN